MDGFLDQLRVLSDLRVVRRRRFSRLAKRCKERDWVQALQSISQSALEEIKQRASGSKNAKDTRWFGDQAEDRIRHLRLAVQLYAPWMLPEFEGLRQESAVELPTETPVLRQLPALIDGLSARLQSVLNSPHSEESGALYRRLLSFLPQARTHVVRLIADLRNIADEAGTFASEMDFKFLLDQKRRLLSIGFDADKQELHGACYDLLATESRIAVFAAIAKDDIPQQTWFSLGRPHTLDKGRAILLSWTGTMFEYLMPALWMRLYPNTLLERSVSAAVRSQRAYVADRGIPWGISESAYFRTDESGNYQYYAFGVPRLALRKLEQDRPVISPYSSFLALHVDSTAALRNLREMKAKRWWGPYGFYEATDFHPTRRRSWFHRYEIVRCWMVHHHGMSLLSIANLLREDVVQRWFHSHPRVQATELLLQEKPTAHPRPVRRVIAVSGAA